MTNSSRERLDQLLVQRGFTRSRARAQAMIRNQTVKVNGVLETKPGTRVSLDAQIELLAPDHPYVSRGGLKLAGALREFSITVRGVQALDVGASTGGFADCLLREGAGHVYCVDVGQEQLAPELREDSRVTCFESTDIRDLSIGQLGAKMDFAVVDVSFIPLARIIPHVKVLLNHGAGILFLVKPQFEVGPANVGKRGIVKDAAVREQALLAVCKECESQALQVKGTMESPIKGGDGNLEYFLYAIKE